MSKVAILVVEDNADMRQAVSAYLRDQGYVVTNSPSAEQSIENRLYENID